MKASENSEVGKVTPQAQGWQFSWPKALLLLAGIGLATFWCGLQNPFLYDDLSVIPNNAWLEWRYLPNFFRSFFPTSEMGFPGYRPLLFALFTAEKQFFGASPPPFRLTNLSLHILNSFLVFLVARSLFFRFKAQPSHTLAFLAALLFLLHPVQSNVITLIWKRSNLLVALGLLGAFHFFRMWVESESRRAPYLVLGWVFALIAFLSKESAFVFLPFLILSDVWIWRSRKTLRQRLLLVYFPVALMSCALFWILFSELPRMLQAMHFSAQSQQPPSQELERWTYLRTQAPAFLEYLRILLVPAQMRVFHWLAPVRTLADTRFWIGVITFCGAVFGALLVRKRFPLVSFSILGFLLLLSPGSSFVPLALPFDEDRLYLPMICIAIGTASIYAELFRFSAERRLRAAKVSLIAIPILIFSLYAAQNVLRIRLWRSPLSLWSHNVREEPRDPRAWINYGEALIGAGETQAGYAAIQKAIDLDPEYGLPPLALGTHLLRNGHPALAREFLFTAYRLNTFRAEALMSLGLTYAGPQVETRAVRYVILSLYDHYDPAALRNLGRLLSQLGDEGRAAQANNLARNLATSP